MDRYRILLLILSILFFVTSVESSREAEVSAKAIIYKYFNDKPRCNGYINIEEDPRMKCQLASVKGRRPYLEDRLVCDQDFRIPFHGYEGTDVVKVGVAAVFDGHKEASTMASEILLRHMFLSSYLANMERNNHFMPWINHNTSSLESLCRSIEESGYVTMDETNHTEILKYALITTIKFMDDMFLQEAVQRNILAGTTAVIVLVVDEQILVANVGDSKALLCSEDGQSHTDEGEFLHLSPKELNNASRVEERARVEADGWFILRSTVPLGGHFPTTRVIGDLPLKNYGITLKPEVTDWQPLSLNDRYVVVASEGIFKSLTPNDVCNLLSHGGDKISPTSSADRIIQSAYEKGSSDNLSIIVVPLK